MTVNSNGFESEVWVGGQPYIEMQPRVWYQLPNAALVQNQHSRPILVASVAPPMVTTPVTWPSAHFRESITALTINAGEDKSLAAGTFIMSTHFRLQPIDENCMYMDPGQPDCSNGGIIVPPGPPICKDLEEYIFCDTSDGKDVIKQVCLMSDGTIQTKYFKEGIEVTYSPSFSASKAQIDVERSVRYATNGLSTDPQFGRVVEVEMREIFRDGVLAPADVTYWDTLVTPHVDVTATVTVAPYDLADAPIRWQLGQARVAITGATPVALSAIPAAATYAEVYVDAGLLDAGIRWTKDLTAPADNSGEQENMGSTIVLFDRPEIDNFRALAINADGVLDAAATANITITYWNIDANED